MMRAGKSQLSVGQGELNRSLGWPNNVAAVCVLFDLDLKVNNDAMFKFKLEPHHMPT